MDCCFFLMVKESFYFSNEFVQCDRTIDRFNKRSLDWSNIKRAFVCLFYMTKMCFCICDLERNVHIQYIAHSQNSSAKRMPWESKQEHTIKACSERVHRLVFWALLFIFFVHIYKRDDKSSISKYMLQFGFGSVRCHNCNQFVEKSPVQMLCSRCLRYDLIFVFVISMPFHCDWV